MSIKERIKLFTHNILRWGYPDGIKDKDEYGFQDVYKCKYCDDDITQDSTRAWFHFKDYQFTKKL